MMGRGSRRTGWRPRAAGAVPVLAVVLAAPLAAGGDAAAGDRAVPGEGDRAPVTTERTRLGTGSAQDRYPTWHPRGDGLAFESDRAGHWDVLWADWPTGETRPLAAGPADERFPAWHPDGGSLLFQSNRDGQPDLYRIHLDDRRTERLTRSPEGEMFATWAPDGESLVYSVQREGTWSLERLALATGEVETLARHVRRMLWPRFHPDGESLLFFSRMHTDGEDDELVSLALGSGSIRRLLAEPGHDFCPTWSTDGTRIAFAAVRDGETRFIGLLDASGRWQGRLGEGFERATEPAFSPDGASVAFVGRTDGDYDIWVEAVPEP